MKNCLLALFIVSIMATQGISWDDKATHKKLTEISFEDYLNKSAVHEKRIGLISEKNFEVVRQIRLITDGAEKEDDSTRPLNHFLNPLHDNPWTNAGFIGSLQAAPVWAQSSKAQADRKADWSWPRTQEYYWRALTGDSQDARDENLALTLRGLGHQMHLLQDMAVPAHVRLDGHLLDAVGFPNAFGNRYFEAWAKSIEVPAFLNNLALSAPRPSINFSSYGKRAEVPSPVAMLFDTDRYTGATPLKDSAIGLAEYTNANFFSTDTGFSPNNPEGFTSRYPYPRWSETDVETYLAGDLYPKEFVADDKTHLAFYISKLGGGGEPITLFLRAGYLSQDVAQESGLPLYLHTLTFYQDERCHRAYAEKLLPRAVGYSAAMLDYFFRGQAEGRIVEAIDAQGQITGVDVRLTNLTKDEILEFPRLVLVGRYRSGPEQSSSYVTSEPAVLGATLGKNGGTGVFELDYSSADGGWNGAGGREMNGEDSGGSGAPGTTALEYLLALRGTLGTEPGTVLAAPLTVGWSEEWREKLTQNHPWDSSQSGVSEEFVTHRIEDGALVMKQIRPAGSSARQVHEIALNVQTLAAGSPAGIELPFEIQPQTRVSVLFPSVTSSHTFPPADCSSAIAQQAILLEFDRFTPMAIITPGSSPLAKYYYTTTPGRREVLRLGPDLMSLGVSFATPVKLTGIRIRQEMRNLCAPATEDQTQELRLDYLRVL